MSSLGHERDRTRDVVQVVELLQSEDRDFLSQPIMCAIVVSWQSLIVLQLEQKNEPIHNTNTVLVSRKLCIHKNPAFVCCLLSVVSRCPDPIALIAALRIFVFVLRLPALERRTGPEAD